MIKTEDAILYDYSDRVARNFPGGFYFLYESLDGGDLVYQDVIRIDSEYKIWYTGWEFGEEWSGNMKYDDNTKNNGLSYKWYLIGPIVPPFFNRSVVDNNEL